MTPHDPPRRHGLAAHTYDNGMNWHPVPAPDGRHYVYVKALTADNWEVYLGDLAGGEHRRLTYYDKLDMLAHISPDGRKMNWGRAIGEGFMSNIHTFVMDVSSLNLGKENYVPFTRHGARRGVAVACSSFLYWLARRPAG